MSLVIENQTFTSINIVRAKKMVRLLKKEELTQQELSFRLQLTLRQIRYLTDILVSSNILRKTVNFDDFRSSKYKSVNKYD